jgi:SAM-dependent methyltransferase
VRAAYKRHCKGAPLKAVLELGCAGGAGAVFGTGCVTAAAAPTRHRPQLPAAAPSPAAPAARSCGPARHATLLARGGARAWGLDTSGPMLEYARGLAAGGGAAVEFVEGDMADFELPVQGVGPGGGGRGAASAGGEPGRGGA